MKAIKLFGLVAVVGLMFTSCDKEGIDKKDKNDYYHSNDYKTSGATILGEEASTFTVLYSVFFHEKNSKQLRYKLVGETGPNKEDVVWEEGDVSYIEYDVTFEPDNSTSVYYATFNEKKDIYTVTFPNMETREVTFELKK